MPRKPKPKAADTTTSSPPAPTQPTELTAPPRTVAELAARVRSLWDLRIAARPVRPGSDAPLAYLVHSFFEGRLTINAEGHELSRADQPAPPDCVIWAARGSGKTFLGAVATALDLLYKPGIEVRILGGSLEQSRRMYEHLVNLLTRDGLGSVLAGKPTIRTIRLRNGSRAEILAQSESSVRGTRVQKLRCDEVDLFDRSVWAAAQLTTRSMKLPGPWGDAVSGAVHSSSTMHVPMGLMWDLVESAKPEYAAHDAAKRTIFRWSVIDALEACPPTEDCTTCSLWTDCQGSAKALTPDEAGHVAINDARQMKGRVSLLVWQSEMLCIRPRLTGCVFPELDWSVHVFGSAHDDTLIPTSLTASPLLCGPLLCGMDFGVRAPTVILWARLDAHDVLHVLDEYAHTGRTVREHIEAITSHPLGMPQAVWCDPAGHARNDQTGISTIAAMNAAGIPARGRNTGIVQGIEALRQRLSPATGTIRLKIHRRCTTLLTSLSRYRYNEHNPSDEIPIKDGNDHAVDALRYLVMGIQSGQVEARRYA